MYDSLLLLCPAFSLPLSLKLPGCGPLCTGVHRKPLGMCGLCSGHVNIHMQARVRGLPVLAAILGGGLFISLPDSYFFDGVQVEHPRGKEPCEEEIMHLGFYRSVNTQACHIPGRKTCLGMTGTPTPIKP